MRTSSARGGCEAGLRRRRLRRRAAARPPATAPAALALLAALAASLASCGGRAPERPSVLLLTLDTTRADALGCYGGRPGVTPHLDALAEEAVLFESARTVAPLTLPAHASMLTGLYPPRHTVRANSLMALPQEAVTIAELAAERGVQTAAFVSAVVLDRGYALDQGFAVYRQPSEPDRPTEHYASRPAGEVVDEALAWLRARDRERPFLAWLHFFDPHKPWEPPPAFLARAGGDPYLAEVAAMDAAIGRLLAALEEEGALDETLVVVVADHGEARGEHGEEGHGPFVFDSTLRVPLLVRHPGGERGGERSDAIVSVADVFPTLAEALDVSPAGAVDGVSLLGAAPEGRGVYFESYLGYIGNGWSPVAGWVDREAKYVHSSAPELYDPRRDPGETENLVAGRAEDVPRYVAAIAEVVARPALGGATLAGDAGALMEKLQALGYSGSGIEVADLPSPLEPCPRPSPHQCVASYERFKRARDRVQGGRPAEALDDLRAIVAAEPLNHSAWILLGTALHALGRYPEALQASLENLRLRGSWRGVEAQLGFCYEALGDDARAIEHFLRAVELEPRWTELRERAAALLERSGRADEARALRARRP